MNASLPATPSSVAAGSPADPRPLLRGLWIFLMLNYLYADLMGLMDARLLAGYLRGEVEGLKLTEGFLLGAALMMEVPILMTLLTERLPPRLCRAATLAAGVFKFSAVAASLLVGKPPSYYLFFALVELSATLVLLALAWRWRVPARWTAER